MRSGKRINFIHVYSFTLFIHPDVKIRENVSQKPNLAVGICQRGGIYLWTTIKIINDLLSSEERLITFDKHKCQNVDDE